MANRNGRGRLNRGENCDETAQADRMGQGRGVRRQPPRDGRGQGQGQGRGLGRQPVGGRGLGRRRRQVL